MRRSEGRKRKIGYARVSTREQNLDRQLDQLTKAGAERIYSDKISGAKEDRPALHDMLAALREGDTVIVSSYDRLARSSKQLFDLAERFESMGVALVSIKEQTDTSTPQGRLFFAMCAAMAQFERELIKERQAEGIAAAKARGRKFGRPSTDASAMDTALRLYLDGVLPVSEICSRTGVSRAALYRKIKADSIHRTKQE